jgi:hypothetical protein
MRTQPGRQALSRGRRGRWQQTQREELSAQAITVDRLLDATPVARRRANSGATRDATAGAPAETTGARRYYVLEGELGFAIADRLLESFGLCAIVHADERYGYAFRSHYKARAAAQVYAAALNVEERERTGLRGDEPEGLERLSQMLLAIGGAASGVGEYECQLDELLRRGQERVGRVRMRKMRPNHCHCNASELWRQDAENRLVTGYALTAPDGGWGQHSWCERDGLIVETTVRRVRYWGMEMAGEEGTRFANANR